MRFYTRSYIIQGDQLDYSSGGKTINYILYLISYAFNKASVVILIKHFSFEKHFLFLRCGCLSGPNYLNLHWKLYFPKNIYRMQNLKILCPSGLTIVALHMTLRVNFFLIVFHDTTLKS